MNEVQTRRGGSDPVARASSRAGVTTRGAGGSRRTQSQPPPELPPRYEDLEAIARGGWGEVRRVRDRVVDRVVAMKILASEHLENDRVLTRFLNEATVTASLEHPGIVPIHDRGVLADGRPWFTMKEVRGRTLHQIVRDELDAAGEERSRRRLVEIFARVCETVAYAHERGLIHRDLKPGNVMVGEFGEVLVVDWGIARAHREPIAAERGERIATDARLTLAGDILGTLSYMPPEQARGANDQLGPASDVFALGLILYEILVGERARAEDSPDAWAQATGGMVPSFPEGAGIPDDARAIYERAVCDEPARRYPDATALGDAVRAWLDGSARRERASRSVAMAESMLPRIELLRARRDEVRSRAMRLLATVRDHDPIEAKRPAWALEDEASVIEQQIALLDAQRIESLRAALEHDAEHEAAHAALATFYRREISSAEARGDAPHAARCELLLRRHDRGEHARFIEGRGCLELDSRPRGARVSAYCFENHDRRLHPVPMGELGITPLSIELPADSYLIEIAHRDRATARLPIRIKRDETWRSIRPGDSAPSAVQLLERLAEHEVYVPAGWAHVGGDPHASEALPARSVWIDGFVVMRHPVTCEEYLAFLEQAGDERMRELCPVWAFGAGGESAEALAVERGADGKLVMRPSAADGRTIGADWPIASIDWRAACAYAEWMAERTGLPWRLPSELEWEKAARGDDRRPYPWGTQPEPTWARLLGSTQGSSSPSGIHEYPIDESPYGVRGLAGNVRDWCLEVWTPEGPASDGSALRVTPPEPSDSMPRTIRGGAWSSMPPFARSAGRFAAKPDVRYATVGFRLARSV